PLLDGMDIKGAKGVILHFKTSSNCSLFEISAAANSIQEIVDENAKIIFGSTTDDSMEDRVEVTIIATGFEDKDTVAKKSTEEAQASKKNPYLSLKKVSGGYDEEIMAQIETPTFLRRQMD
ncbi:TPA: cell division protein FtsZ, partial [Campylobacter jejuni]